MKTEDFERLKAVCEKEGFVVSTGGVIPGDSMLIEVYKKDHWDGVEFYQDHLGVVRKMTDDVLKVIKGGVKLLLHPSTESAYIDQLKKEAFERFGEIKKGDRFNRDFDGFYDKIFSIGDRNYQETGFIYEKDTDALMFHGHTIYKQGKWATRVNDRVEVKWDGSYSRFCNDKFSVDFILSEKDEKKLDGAGKFLAKQLEKYLNGEV